MNYIRAKKAQNNEAYAAEYKSRMEAFQELKQREDLVDRETRDQRKALYSRLIAEQRVYEDVPLSDRTKTTNSARMLS
jgi:hypothetical protein